MKIYNDNHKQINPMNTEILVKGCTFALLAGLDLKFIAEALKLNRMINL